MSQLERLTEGLASVSGAACLSWVGCCCKHIRRHTTRTFLVSRTFLVRRCRSGAEEQPRRLTGEGGFFDGEMTGRIRHLRPSW
ncbi:uncharacterized protein B0I36DRAFT_327409 [Microdochium trichocladiopsis]|uniref:Uncharacterized protein n=1 Tax=Microdochium trichocladiopsis TaxID=1682393 RepID=A0A9P8Y0I7_9PEZI|nr:uncharacterized protein B0I36DRAFT_327409 [Microdochium trichocladiopsis]KAH7027583.1 hypothetical protein B0I36DRAFT_327409 [Microdochium trichocladiopsis]